MLKNTHTKTILVFIILGIVTLTAFGIFNIIELIELKENLTDYNNILLLEGKIAQIKKITIIINIGYATISLIITLIYSKIASKPIIKMIANAKKVVSTQGKNENSDELVDTFNAMTEELQGSLNEMSRQKKQIETIISHMNDGIIAFNMEGKAIIINPAANRMLRLLPSDTDFNKIFKQKLNIDVNMEKIIYLEDWTSSEQNVKVGEKYLNMFFAQFKDENERPSGIMVLIQDITEHVRLDNMRKEFVADVSHELKTPITSIMGYADTLLEGEYDKETQAKFLNVIATEARRMAKLVTDLLTLSRFDNNKILQEKTKFDLGELVKQCQEKLQIQIDKKKHRVECFVTADVPPVYADREGIERVVLNILSNSIKYTNDGGVIKIYVGFVYNDAYIKIIDNGMGIPEDDLKRIFERFYRVDKARTRELGGTGLGLSIAKEILDRNNGSIDIKSQKGKGTEVVVRVPTK